MGAARKGPAFARMGLLACLGLACADQGRAADMAGRSGYGYGYGYGYGASEGSAVCYDVPAPSGQPRYFPRSEGEPGAGAGPRAMVRRCRPGCAPRQVPIPTDAPDDPSYVGSEYGLGKPSYYGFRPGLGHDDPFGRPLRYCN